MEQPNLALDPYPSRYGCCHVTCFSSATARQHQNPQVAAETITPRNPLRAPLHSLRDVGGPNQKQNYMAVLVQNGMVITLFTHPVAHSNRQPNLALNPCPQRWVLSFMSHVFLAQRQRQHNPTIDCNATCIQTSSRQEQGEPLCSQSGSRRERGGHHPMRKIQQSAAETATPAKTLHTPFLNPGSPRTQDTLLLRSPGKPS